MATVLGLALKISADASGVQKSLTPVQRAFEQLDAEAKKVTDVFKTFEASSAGAGAAQQKFATDLSFLQSAFRTGQIDARKYAEEFALIQEEAASTSAAFSEGIRVTEASRTAEENRAIQLARLNELFELGAISQETFNRASDEASGANAAAAAAAADAAEAERNRLSELSRLQSESAAITARYSTDAERRAQSVAQLDAAIADGRISEETYARAIDDVTGATAAAATAEQERLNIVRQGEELSRRFATADENRAASLADVESLLRSGAITEETAARARAEFSGDNAAAARIQADAESERAAAIAAAARIVAANSTPQERYDEQMQELNTHLREGRISQESFNRAMEKASADLTKAGASATQTDKSLESLVRNTNILASIEIGRLFFDGLRALSSVFRDISSRVTSLVSSVNSGIDSLNDLSARTGIGVEQLQGYGFAAKLAGVDAEQFGSAVQRLAITIGKAAPGDAFDKSLKEINLSVEQLQALSPEQQFSAIGAAISELPTAAARAAAAVALFGKQGAALAPLFREGADGIEELQARAKRLGVIVSETQVNNVADMNDGFDKVLATVNGIIGQVIGDLAPAVTAVTDQFLEFVETFEGTGVNKGGTGIANAITDTLLQGALYFAEIFDAFVKNFDSLGITFADAGSNFNSSASAFTAVAEGLRVVANLFELTGNGLLKGIGSILETIGSFVSGDLEQAGKDLQAQAAASIKQNVEEANAALANAQAGFDGIFTGVGAGSAAAGEGAGADFIGAMIAKIENERKPEVRLELNLAETEERLQAFLEEAGIEASTFLNQSVATVDAFQGMLDAGELTADQIAIMVRFNEDLNVELEKSEATRRSEKEATEAQAAAEAKRIETLLGASAASVKVEQDLRDIRRAQADTLLDLAAASRTNDTSQQAAAASRLAQLDALETSLESQQQALRQGFSSGFDQAFESVDTSISELIDKSAEFGAAGEAAAQQLKDGIAEARAEASDGFYTKEQYDEEVQRVKDLYAVQVKAVEDLANERKAVNDFVDEQLALNAFGGDSQRLESARRVLEIEEEMGRVQEEIKAARQAGDGAAVNAAAARLGQLDQVAAKERDIVNGRAAYEEQQQKMRDEALQAQQQAQQAQQAEQKRFFEEQQKAAAAEAKRQEERLTKLNTLGQQSIAAQDVRTTEGANLVLQLSASGQDPSLIQQRLQTKYLEEMNTNLRQAALNYFNSPVAIVGGPPMLRPR